MRVTERPIAIQGQIPMGWWSHHRRCQNIFVGVVVILKDTRGADDQRATFLQRVRVVAWVWRVIDRGDCDRYVTLVRTTHSIRNSVGKAVAR